MKYFSNSLIALNTENIKNFISTAGMNTINNLLKIKISELELTTRTSNSLEILGIKTIADLVSYTENSLLRTPNFGQKSLNELKNILDRLSTPLNEALYLGMEIDFTEIENPKINQELIKLHRNKADDFLKDNLKKLLLPIDQIDFTVRTVNVLKNENITCIGDLVNISKKNLISSPNFGRKSYDEIVSVLETMSLSLEMNIPQWPVENYEELVNNYKPSLDLKFDFDSLKIFLNEKFDSKEKIIYENRFLKGDTLDKLGKKFNLSRERIRQIESRMFRKTSKYKEVFSKFLNSEREYIFKILSNNGNLISYKSLKNFKNRNPLFIKEKDALIKFCIIASYENTTNFCNIEYHEAIKTEFNKHSRSGKINHLNAWRKEPKVKKDTKINSGIFILK